ncbi:hypothetical protein PTKIN_Ptkin04bG0234600 [Pterospermum kingtungense]
MNVSVKGYSLNSEEVAPFIKPGMQKSAAPSIEGPEFSLDELKEKTNNFGSKALIGKGSRGSVFHANLNNGKAVAVKKLDISNVDFMAQVSLVKGLKHDNLVELQCYFAEGDLRVLANEFATTGSLHDVLHGTEGVKLQEPQPVQVLDWMQRLRIAVDVARGLEYLNEKAPPSVGCRFITSKNIFLFENFKAKIECNLSNQSNDIVAQVLRTSGYLPPEYGLTRQFTEKTAVFSLGVVLIELLTGRKPVDLTRGLLVWVAPMLDVFYVEDCVDPKLNGKYHVGGAAELYFYSLAGVAALCILRDPDHRPTMKSVAEALQHVLNYNATKSAEYRTVDMT